ncbi:MAG: hypothetical protein DLM68_18635 [Hyphomicrobiales bacterium]|nr:MAG: hypothetical protein DLM68_18635 [Hyphomicrobiales bacterium]
MAGSWNFAKQGDGEAATVSASQERGTFGPAPAARRGGRNDTPRRWTHAAARDSFIDHEL